MFKEHKKCNQIIVWKSFIIVWKRLYDVSQSRLLLNKDKPSLLLNKTQGALKESTEIVFKRPPTHVICLCDRRGIYMYHINQEISCLLVPRAPSTICYLTYIFTHPFCYMYFYRLKWIKKVYPKTKGKGRYCKHKPKFHLVWIIRVIDIQIRSLLYALIHQDLKTTLTHHICWIPLCQKWKSQTCLYQVSVPADTVALLRASSSG